MRQVGCRVSRQVRRCWMLLTAFGFHVTAAAVPDCAGDIAGSVIGTFLVTIVLCGLGYFAFRYYQKKKGKNRPLTSDSSDSEVGGQYVYDNPHFQEEEPVNNRRTPSSLDAVERGEVAVDITKNNSTLENRNQGNAAKLKKGKNAKSNLLSGLKNGKAHKQRALDDSCINLGPEKIVVPLRGIDFTGLGFNVCGNMRDGIFIKDVLHRGPAMESGKIKAGDRISSVTVSFANMVYEDALTILSYASPYDVQLEIQKTADSGRLPGHQKKGSNASNASGLGSGYGAAADQLYHPLYRSQSIGDLSKIGRDDASAKRSLSVGGPAAKLGTKKEAPVKTSHSLREEGTVVEVDNEKPSAGSPLVTAAKVSRFRVQKVAEAEDAVADESAEPVEGRPEAGDGDADGKSSSSSEDGDHVQVVPEPLPSPEERESLSTTDRHPVDDLQVAGDDDGSPADAVCIDLIHLECGDGRATAPVPTRRISVPGKRKAPLPPSGLPDDYWTDTVQENVTVVSTNRHHVTMLKVSPDIHRGADWAPAAVASQTHFSSESDSSSDEGGDAPPGARRRKSKDRTRRASSLGDLTHVEETAAAPMKTFLLERSVSMDRAHAMHCRARHRPTVVGGGIDPGAVDPGEDHSLVPAAGTLTKHFTARENLHLDNGDRCSWDTLGDATDTSKTNGTDRSTAAQSDGESSDEDRAPRLSTTVDDDMSDVSLSDLEFTSGGRSKPVIRKMTAVDLSPSDHGSYASSSSDDEEAAAPHSSYIRHDVVTGSSLVTIGEAPSTAVSPTSATLDPELTKIFNNVIVSNVSKDPFGSETSTHVDAKNGTTATDYADDLLVRLEDSPPPPLPPNGNGPVSPNLDRRYDSNVPPDAHDHFKFGVIRFESSLPGGHGVLQKMTATDPGFTNYTVSEGGLAHAVIISNPQLTAPTTAPSDLALDSPPALQPPE